MSHTRSVSTISSRPPEGVSAVGSGQPQPGDSIDLLSRPLRSKHQRNASALPSPAPARSQPTNTVRSEDSAPQTHNKLPAKASVPKAAFDTFRQHYSPRTPSVPTPAKPLTLNSSRPGDANHRNEAAEPRLQDELLQLALVYQHSSKTLKDFEHSVQCELNLAAARLQKQQQDVSALEADHQKQVNAVAISTWLLDSERTLNRRKIEDLSFCLNELASIDEEGGIYAQVMSEFDQWVDNTKLLPRSEGLDIWEVEGRYELHKLHTPGVSWHRKVDTCHERLKTCWMTLQAVGDDDADSGIGITLSTHGQLVSTMMLELLSAKDVVDKLCYIREQNLLQTLENAVDALEETQVGEHRKGVWSSVESG